MLDSAHPVERPGWVQTPTNRHCGNHEMPSFQPSFQAALPTFIPNSSHPSDDLISEALDIWQAPTNFEWDDWASFVDRFRLE